MQQYAPLDRDDSMYDGRVAEPAGHGSEEPGTVLERQHDAPPPTANSPQKVTMHGVMLPIEGAMARPQDVYGAIDSSVLIVSLVYIVFGVAAYAAFGDGTDPSVMDDLPEGSAAQRVAAASSQMLLVVSMALTVRGRLPPEGIKDVYLGHA